MLPKSLKPVAVISILITFSECKLGISYPTPSQLARRFLSLPSILHTTLLSLGRTYVGNEPTLQNKNKFIELIIIFCFGKITFYSSEPPSVFKLLFRLSCLVIMSRDFGNAHIHVAVFAKP